MSAFLLNHEHYKPLGLNDNEVSIVAYNHEWPALYRDERDQLFSVLTLLNPSIEHIGSTAVPGLNAKPIIDIMVGLPDTVHMPVACSLLENFGYLNHGEKGISGRIFFTKGNECSHHLHLVESGGEFWHEHILFRDELIHNPLAAARYLGIKLTLADRYSNNRPKYTDGKAAVIESILLSAIARQKMQGLE